jgi:protein phosphatase methylesterase 1
MMYISGSLEHDLIFLHHGAGYTAQTWLPLIARLRRRLPDVCFVAADMRAHGKSIGNGCVDVSLDALVEDVDVLLAYLLRNAAGVVDVHLVGHSLGAAVLAAFSHSER